MRWWSSAALVAAVGFVFGLIALFVSILRPELEYGARSIVVGSGALLASLLTFGLYSSLREAQRDDDAPLASVHPRRWHQRR